VVGQHRLSDDVENETSGHSGSRSVVGRHRLSDDVENETSGHSGSSCVRMNGIE
jgi:hypothetical protein